MNQEAAGSRSEREPGDVVHGPIHLAVGESAAGSIRSAIEVPGLPGVVIAIQDDPGHGPLDEVASRTRYLLAGATGYQEPAPGTIDVLTSLEHVHALLRPGDAREIVIWGGDNVADATFVALACWSLADPREAILGVAGPVGGPRRYVAEFAPEELAALYAVRRDLGDEERQSLALDFVRMRDTTGLLRRWEEGRVVGMPVSSYDYLLLGACGPDWTRAARIVGTAMGSCDPANLQGDLFFSSRLQVLIDGGHIQADGPRRNLLDYAVRRTGA